jgi:hypothetical protein
MDDRYRVFDLEDIDISKISLDLTRGGAKKNAGTYRHIEYDGIHVYHLNLKTPPMYIENLKIDFIPVSVKNKLNLIFERLKTLMRVIHPTSTFRNYFYNENDSVIFCDDVGSYPSILGQNPVSDGKYKSGFYHIILKVNIYYRKSSNEIHISPFLSLHGGIEPLQNPKYNAF